MRINNRIQQLLHDESGRILGNVIILAILLAVVAVVIFDSVAAFSAYSTVSETTNQAAAKAKEEYDNHKGDIRAENAAADYCEKDGLVFEEFTILYDNGHTYRIACSKEVDTYVFKYIPWLKELTYQKKEVITSEL